MRCGRKSYVATTDGWYGSGCRDSRLSVPAIDTPVGERLGQVPAVKLDRFVEIGDGTGHLQHALAGPGRETDALCGVFEEPPQGGIQLAVLAHQGAAEVRVGHPGARQLHLARGHHATAHGGAAFWRGTGTAAGHPVRPRDLDVQVDAVEQRAGQPAPVALNLVRGAAAAPAAVAGVAAGAGLRCLFAICSHFA